MAKEQNRRSLRGKQGAALVSKRVRKSLCNQGLLSVNCTLTSLNLMLGIKHHFHTPSLHLNHTLDQRKKANTEVVGDFVIGLLLS